MMQWMDPQRRLPDTGNIALQVHGGGDLNQQFVRYRNVRVKTLPVACCGCFCSTGHSSVRAKLPYEEAVP